MFDISYKLALLEHGFEWVSNRFFSRLLNALEYKNLSEIKATKQGGTKKKPITVPDNSLIAKITKQKKKILQAITSWLPPKHKKAGEGIVYYVPDHLRPKNNQDK